MALGEFLKQERWSGLINEHGHGCCAPRGVAGYSWDDGVPEALTAMTPAYKTLAHGRNWNWSCTHYGVGD